MVYRLINPSAPYTFEAETLEVAALTVIALSIMYGAESEDKKSCVPVLMFGEENLDKWFEGKFGRAVEESVEANRQGLCTALKSMLYGDFSDRKVYKMAVSKMDSPEKIKAFTDEWQDRRSSMNDISGHAHAMSEELAGKGGNRIN
ncbi:MAG: hypothetical protein LUE14_07945 [Clostridiales bacterium]|nr:hypothetical protein [Clostridiales bacterium]